MAALYLALLIAITLWRGYRYAAVVRRCRGLRRADREIGELVARTCHQHGIHRSIDVRVSGEASAPFVVGLFRPMLVLSPRHLADTVEAEAVILHEIGHVRPFDVVLRCLQCLVGTLLFFWPVVAWVNRRIDLAREHACDDWALSHGKLSAAEYARCLLRALQPVRSSWSIYRPAAMAANRRHVERRIEMILQHPDRSRHARSLGSGGPFGCRRLGDLHAQRIKARGRGYRNGRCRGGAIRYRKQEDHRHTREPDWRRPDAGQGRSRERW
ncbi:MAG: M56 family metallopeptidase [Planctomycetes bacterium]|nr:M56 family metallopeptidase [Planctomycetota bacterium]